MADKELKIRIASDGQSGVQGVAAVTGAVDALKKQTQILAELEVMHYKARAQGSRDAVAQIEKEMAIRRDAIALMRRGVAEGQALGLAAQGNQGQNVGGLDARGALGFLGGQALGAAGLTGGIAGVITLFEKVRELKEEFKALGQAQDAAMKALGTGNAGAGVGQIISNVAGLTANVRDLNAEINRLKVGVDPAQNPFGAVGRFAVNAAAYLTGGGSPEERAEELRKLRNQLIQKQNLELAESVKFGERELDIQRLLAEGQTELAAQKQRELEAEREIARLRSLELPGPSPKKLEQQILDAAAIRQEAADRKSATEDNQRLRMAQGAEEMARLIAEHRLDEAEALRMTLEFVEKIQAIEADKNQSPEVKQARQKAAFGEFSAQQERAAESAAQRKAAFDQQMEARMERITALQGKINGLSDDEVAKLIEKARLEKEIAALERNKSLNPEQRDRARKLMEEESRLRGLADQQERAAKAERERAAAAERATEAKRREAAEGQRKFNEAFDEAKDQMLETGDERARRLGGQRIDRSNERALAQRMAMRWAEEEARQGRKPKDGAIRAKRDELLKNRGGAGGPQGPAADPMGDAADANSRLNPAAAAMGQGAQQAAQGMQDAGKASAKLAGQTAVATAQFIAMAQELAKLTGVIPQIRGIVAQLQAQVASMSY